MDISKIAGIALIVLAVIGLMYGGFSYTEETTKVKIGSFEIKAQEEKNINVPIIVSAGGLALGLFLVLGSRKK